MKKVTLNETIKATEALRKILQTALMKKVHKNSSKKYVERAEQLIKSCRAIIINGMTDEEFRDLCDLEDLQEMIYNLYELKARS